MVVLGTELTKHNQIIYYFMLNENDNQKGKIFKVLIFSLFYCLFFNFFDFYEL